MRFDWPARLNQEVVSSFYREGWWTKATASDWLESAARSSPDATALVDASQRLTYQQYAQRARNLAASFVALGLGRDDLIAIQLPNCVEFALTVNAAMLAGIPFCQMHHGFRSKEVRFALGFANARAVVIRQEYRGFDYLAMIRDLQGDLPNLCHVIAIADSVAPDCIDFDAAARRSPNPEDERRLRAAKPESDDICRVAFTSGTTGDPKAVVHTHNTSNSTARSSARDQCLTARSAMLLFLPVGLNWGLGCTMQALNAGAKLVYMDRFDAPEALSLIQRERITHFVTAPASLDALVDAAERAKYDLSSLEVMVTGGASCSPEILRRARLRLPGCLVDMYGMLESGVQSRTYLDDDPEEVMGTVGRPTVEAKARVADEHDVPVGTGIVGQVECFGPSVMLGYLNNPAANASAFSADGWFRTGDLGVFDERGLLRIVGRTKEMIIRGGANVYPREIEEVLFEHPKVADCAVVGAPHPRLGETVVACVVPRPGTTLSFDEMIAFLERRVARYKLPERLYITEQLPRGPTGKVQKGSLVALIART
ncbi:MAG TPA: AMP-binding protein [Candidatus Dormibacteraeota bacterium]|nr:AMP-binding protein [Candidatus Dormibacteraeota bacterium]